MGEKAGSSKSSKGIPRKARSASRKARRAKNLSSQPLKKIRNLLNRNGIRAAFEWADSHACLPTLRIICPDYQEQLRELGKKEAAAS